MRFARYLLCAALICTTLSSYAADEDSGYLRSDTAFSSDQSSSDEINQIILDLGISLYKKGLLDEAQEQFNKVLILNPNDKTALKYSKLINKRLGTTKESTTANGLPPSSTKAGLSRDAFIKQQLESMGLNDKEAITPPEKTTAAKPVIPAPKTAKIPKILMLDKITQKPAINLEIEKNEILVVKDTTIRRFLNTQPGIINVEQHGDVLYVTGKNIGPTYLYVWDAQQRWTLEFRVILAKQAGLNAEANSRFIEEKAKDLQVRYSIIANYDETRYPLPHLTPNSRFHAFQHILESANPLSTPYGDFGFSFSLNSVPGKTEVDYASLSLLDGRIGSFKHVNVQAIDFQPAGTDLAFSKGDLRGVQISSPVIENKLAVRAFWGEELGLRFGGFVPPDIANEKPQIYYSGLSLGYRPYQNQNYTLSAYKGGGRDRTPDQNKYSYDASALYIFNKLKLLPEIAYDTENYASTLRVDYTQTYLQVLTELRDISRNFQAISGKDWRAGQRGALVNIHYRPCENLSFSSQSDVYTDTLFPNPALPGRWNKEVDLGALWRPFSLLEAQGDYNYRNDLGKNFPTITQDAGFGLHFNFPTARRINVYLNYNLVRDRYINTPSLDYNSHKIKGGTRISLFPTVYCFVEKEINNVTPLANPEKPAKPEVLQTGIEWSSQIYGTSLHQTLRFTYRDENNTDSPFSFLVGEDYLEGYGEIAYAPASFFNIGLNARVRDIRTETSPSIRRVETEAAVTVNYLFDTYMHVDPVGTIKGYVFKDLNMDGIKQPEEPGIANVEVRVGRNRVQRTNEYGSYRFFNVKAKKVSVRVNTANIPEGYIVTGPAMQEAAIVHNGKTEVDFAVSTRTEIHGAVFVDIDGDKKFGLNDKGVPGVTLVLENGIKVFTDSSGVFSRRLPAGDHKITLDLATLPEKYMPLVPIFYNFSLEEGQSINYSIPVNEIQ